MLLKTLQLKALGNKVRIKDYGVRIKDYNVWITDYGLRGMDYVTDYGLSLEMKK